MKQNKNFKITVLQKGNLQNVDIEGIDIENHGTIEMHETNLKDTGYVNEKSGITNIEGKFNTNSPIQNKGLFNIPKTGEVNLFMENVKKSFVKYPFWATIFSGVLIVLIGWILTSFFMWLLSFLR
jgi:hypothetical protein